MINFIIIYIFFFFISNEIIFFDSEKIIILGFFLLIFSLINFLKEFFNTIFNDRRNILKNSFYSYYESIIFLLNSLMNLNNFYKIFLNSLKNIFISFISLLINFFNFKKSKFYNFLFFKFFSFLFLLSHNIEIFNFLKLLFNKKLFNLFFVKSSRMTISLNYNLTDFQFANYKFFG